MVIDVLEVRPLAGASAYMLNADGLGLYSGTGITAVIFYNAPKGLNVEACGVNAPAVTWIVFFLNFLKSSLYKHSELI